MKTKQNMLTNTRGRLLWFFTPAAACVSGLSLLAALCGKEWIHMEERILNTTMRDLSLRREFFVKKTYAGLFNICETDPGEHFFKCSKIDLFSESVYVSDISDSSSSVPYAILQSLVFFLLAASLLMVAEMLLLYGYLQKRKRFLLPVAGLFFIISGLMILLGIVVFIATLKGEIAEKLRPESSYEPPLVTYDYGWSFLLILVGFISEEMSGVLTFFFYKHWHKHYLLMKARNNSSPLPRDAAPTVTLRSVQAKNFPMNNVKQWKPPLTSSYSLPSLPTAPNDQPDREQECGINSMPISHPQPTSTAATFKSPKFSLDQNNTNIPPHQSSVDYWETSKQNSKKPNDLFMYTNSLHRNVTRNSFSNRLNYSPTASNRDVCKVCESNVRMEKFKYSTIGVPRRRDILYKERFPRPYNNTTGYSYASEYDCWCSCYYENNVKCCEYCCNSHYTCCSYGQNPIIANKLKLSAGERLITV